MRTTTGRVALTVLVLAIAAPLLAPLVAPNAPATQFRDHLFAPPMPIRVRGAEGAWHLPFVYPLRLVDRLERRFEEDRTRRIPLVGGPADARDGRGPVLLLGADSLGRDLFSRLLYGARASLGVALAAVAGALAIGVAVGAIAGYVGGPVDEGLMRVSEVVLVLPTIYVLMALRATLPLVLEPDVLSVLIALLLAVVGWPTVARGVRTIVRTEGSREYAEAARCLGASPVRILVRHLVPATAGFLRVQAALLLPAFVIAEATLSFVGLGFSEPTPSWGTMLVEAANVRVVGEAPWLLAPAAAIMALVAAITILTGHRPGNAAHNVDVAAR